MKHSTTETGCVDPPIPPKEHNLTMDYENGTEVALAEVVSYSCKEGHSFIEEPGLTHFEVVCLENGTFENPKYWKGCTPPSGNLI